MDSHKYVLAPMVDHSELAWRMLARKYGAHVTFTPMINMKQFMNDMTYRSKAIEFSEKDRPCIAQVCNYLLMSVYISSAVIRLNYSQRLLN